MTNDHEDMVYRTDLSYDKIFQIWKEIAATSNGFTLLVGIHKIMDIKLIVFNFLQCIRNFYSWWH